MNRRNLLAAGLGLALLSPLSLHHAFAAQATVQPADVPAPKMRDGQIEPRFQMKHESFLQRAKAGKIGVLFLGDSITEGWTRAPQVWESHFGKYDPANFGIGGDRTQHVLWRMDNGELEGISPKVVVLMIGTNNMGANTAEEIVKADRKIVQTLLERIPHTQVLLLGIFPRGADPKVPAIAATRDKIKAINAELAKLEGGKRLRYLDITASFLDAEGNLPADVMPDALHPNLKGYEIWAEAMQPLLDEMMK